MNCPTCKDLARVFEAGRSSYSTARSAAYYRVSTELAAYKNVEMERAKLANADPGCDFGQLARSGKTTV